MNVAAKQYQIHHVADNCVNCKVCVKECKFLDTYATPGDICNEFISGKLAPSTLFKCNLCGLCDAVCPKKLSVVDAFLSVRKSITAANESILKNHKRICNYEDYGHSKLFSLYEIPDNCSTVFFPGCTLNSTKSTTTERTFHHLRQFIPDIGIVLDCCHKPSRDLGRTERFEEKFSAVIGRLEKQGIKKIITACPSCHVTFREYAGNFEITTVYEELIHNPPAIEPLFSEEMSIHDTCVTRFDTKLHDSVRQLSSICGISIKEAPHCREKTICCGEGGAAVFIAPDITKGWKEIRKMESESNRVITYCAGCSSTLGEDIRSSHLLDLLFNSVKTKNNQEQQTKSPYTYFRKLQLKIRLKVKGTSL